MLCLITVQLTKLVFMKKSKATLNAIFLFLAMIFYSSPANAEIKRDCDEFNKVCIVLKVEKDYIDLEIENKTYANKTVKLNLKTENISFSNKISEFINLPAKNKIFISRLSRKNLTIPMHLEYTHKYSLSDVFSKPDNYVYSLPYEKGQNFKIIQGFNGSFTHNTDLTRYALDFRMPVGTPITAARDGVVIEVVDKYSKGGQIEKLKKQANYIYIQHSDGTVAAYLHIKNKGALVKEGDVVKAGQKIALSGFTGYADVPHLHFAVLKSFPEMEEKSIKFEYR
jgi:murein DD-endopeptidase MepM/ murein hydrolase activator NlpD